MSNGTAIAQRPQAKAYLAGTGLSFVLIAGAVAAFLALGAYVAFNGLPFAGSGSGSDRVTLRAAQARAAAANARAALGGAPGAAAARPGGRAGARGAAGGAGGGAGGGKGAGGGNGSGGG